MAWDDFYVKETATGAGDGSTAADAAGFVADFAVIKAHLAGVNNRVILCYGGTPWTPAQVMTWDNAAGSSTGYNAVVGADSSGTVGADIVEINGEGGTYNGFSCDSSYCIFEDIKIYNYDGTAWTGIGDFGRFNRIEGTSCNTGFNGGSLNNGSIINSKFNSNNIGCINIKTTAFLFNEVISNTSYGASTATGGVQSLYNVFAKNGDDGFRVESASVTMFNICDGNAGAGIKVGDTYTYSVAHNKLTNNTGAGLEYEDSDTRISYQDYNAFFNNSSEVDHNGAFSEGQGANNITLTEDYYNDDTSNDYTSSTDDPSVGYAIKIGNSDTNIGYISNQFPPVFPTGTAPTFAGLTGSQMLSDNHLDLAWSAGTDLTYYIVFISASSLTYASSEIADIVPFGTNKTTVCHLSDGTRLQAGTRYYYDVRALNVGTSAFSANTTEMNYTCVGRGGSAPVYIKNVNGT